jgi:hypothetical protein
MYIYPCFFPSDLPIRLLSPDRRRVLPYSFDLTPDLRDPVVPPVYCAAKCCSLLVLLCCALNKIVREVDRADISCSAFDLERIARYRARNARQRKFSLGFIEARVRSSLKSPRSLFNAVAPAAKLTAFFLRELRKTASPVAPQLSFLRCELMGLLRNSGA